MKKTVFIITMSVMALVSCSKSDGRGPETGPGADALIDCTNVAATFTADVNLIIQTSCATNSGCHGSGSHNGPGELLTYNEIFNARIAIRSAVTSGAMPLGSKLSTIQKNTVACWVDRGGPQD